MHSLTELSHSLYFSPARWRDPSRPQPSVTQLFLFHVLPFSLIPTLMLYFLKSSNVDSVLYLPPLPQGELLGIVAAFWAVQLIGVPAMAFIIQQLGEIIDARISFREGFAIAAIAPTPLWLSSLLLIVPSVAFYLAVFSLAVAASGVLIFRLVPEVLKPEDTGQTSLLSGAIFVTGLVGLAFLMVMTNVLWNLAM